MPHGPYMPRDDGGKNGWLKNFATKLPNYTTLLSIAPVEVTAVQNDSQFWDYLVNAHAQFGVFGKDLTLYKNQARKSTQPLSPLPIAPILNPPAVAPVNNIFGRAASLVVRIKAHPSYTDNIGADLDIVGPDIVVDMSTEKPRVSLKALNGGSVEVDFSKSDADGVNIYSKRQNDPNWVYLALDTQSPYLDNRPQLVPGQPEQRQYRAVYVINNQEIGQPSDTVVTVTTP